MTPEEREERRLRIQRALNWTTHQTAMNDDARFLGITLGPGKRLQCLLHWSAMWPD